MTRRLDLTHRRVMARRRIEQSPFDEAPAVPGHAIGSAEDFDDCAGLYAIDFGEPYGVVLVEPSEIADWPRTDP